MVVSDYLEPLQRFAVFGGGRIWRLTIRKDCSVNKDQIKGTAKQVKGSVKEAIGKVTGNTATESEGKAEKAAGKVQDAYGDAKAEVKRKLDR